MLFCSISAHFSEIQLVCDRRTDRPTDGRTDGRTDTPSYRDARTHLKRERSKDGQHWSRSRHEFDLGNLLTRFPLRHLLFSSVCFFSVSRLRQPLISVCVIYVIYPFPSASLSFHLPSFVCVTPWSRIEKTQKSERSGARQCNKKCRASKRVSSASKRANGRASDLVLTSGFLAVLPHCLGTILVFPQLKIETTRVSREPVAACKQKRRVARLDREER